MRTLIIALVVLSLTACTPLRMYHNYEGKPLLSTAGAVKTKCQQNPVTKNVNLGFIEFDEFGNLMDPDSYSRLMEEIHAIKEPVLLVSYTHGWKHNGDPEDDDVKKFTTALRNIASMDGCQNRRVIGIYTAWRGGVTKIPLLKEFTFWDRKSTAHAVGGGAMTEVLLRLEQERNWRNAEKDKIKEEDTEKDKWLVQSRMVYIGHSFGTAVLYSALAPIMVERFMRDANFSDDSISKGEPSSCGDNFRPQTVGDLVVLLNPAFEAMRFSSMYKLSRKCSYSPGQPVILAVVTGKNDGATNWLFPIGRGPRAAFQKYWKSTEVEDVGYRANTDALGHYDGYITHNLSSIDKPKPHTQTAAGNSEDDDVCGFAYEDPSKAPAQARIQYEPAAMRLHFERFDLKLEPTAKHQLYSPILNISGDAEIINHHGGIYGCKLMAFISTLIQDGAPALNVQMAPTAVRQRQ